MFHVGVSLLLLFNFFYNSLVLLLFLFEALFILITFNGTFLYSSTHIVSSLFDSWANVSRGICVVFEWGFFFISSLEGSFRSGHER